MKIAMIGGGAWGRAIAEVLKRNGHTVFFIHTHDSWPLDQEIDYIFLAIPCQAIREKISSLQLPQVPFVSLAKGIEIGTGLLPSEILTQLLPRHKVAVVSGPSLAHEVQQVKPTTLVVASSESSLVRPIQQLLRQQSLRVYRSYDRVGVELGGALKNVYAIAAGMAKGLEVGENGMAGLVTRSLAEMVRLAELWGARRETFFGLSGMGDLVLTCYSGHSRNHQVGEKLAKGLHLTEVLAQVQGTAEGVFTTDALFKIVQEKQVRVPILTEVYRVLYQQKAPYAALQDLMTRQVEEE